MRNIFLVYMPLNNPFVRFSYLKKEDFTTNPTQLLQWLQFAQTTIEENEKTITQLLVDKEKTNRSFNFLIRTKRQGNQNLKTE